MPLFELNGDLGLLTAALLLRLELLAHLLDGLPILLILLLQLLYNVLVVSIWVLVLAQSFAHVVAASVDLLHLAAALGLRAYHVVGSKALEVAKSEAATHVRVDAHLSGARASPQADWVRITLHDERIRLEDSF